MGDGHTAALDIECCLWLTSHAYAQCSPIVAQSCVCAVFGLLGDFHCSPVVHACIVHPPSVHRASFWDLYASPAPKAGKDADSCDWVEWVDVREVIRKCAAKGAGQPLPAAAAAEGLHCFEVKGTYNPATKKLSAAPADFKAGEGDDAMEVDGAAAAAATAPQQQQQKLDASLAMSSLDIFAGCGGLSEGMHQVGFVNLFVGVVEGGFSDPKGSMAAVDLADALLAHLPTTSCPWAVVVWMTCWSEALLLVLWQEVEPQWMA